MNIKTVSNIKRKVKSIEAYTPKLLCFRKKVPTSLLSSAFMRDMILLRKMAATPIQRKALLHKIDVSVSVPDLT
jgi:predicted nucleic acid-binding Zn ribbon protein